MQHEEKAVFMCARTQEAGKEGEREREKQQNDAKRNGGEGERDRKYTTRRTA